MTINLQKPDITELKPRITVFGVGGGGGNAVNNMITGGLEGIEFVVANTDAQALTMSSAEKLIQLGVDVTEGLGAGSHPEVGRAAAEECLTEIQDYLANTHMAFVTAGMGGGTGTGAAPVVARAAREMGILTVGVVTKPFQFEGSGRMKTAEAGIEELQKHVDSLIVIPNQNLFRIANDKTTFADAFGMADQVLYSGVACITDLMVKEGLINLDFADVRSVMRDMGKAMMGTGESSGEGRALQAAEAAISNPLLDESSMRGAEGLLISITGGRDLTLFEVDEAATRIREEIDGDANIILGATFDESLEGIVRVSVVATGIDSTKQQKMPAPSTGVSSEAVTRGAPKPQAAIAPMVPAEPAVKPVAQTTPSSVERAPQQRAPEASKQGAELQSDQLEEAFKSALASEFSADDGFVVPVSKEPASITQAAPIPAASAEPRKVPTHQPAAPTAQTNADGNGPKGLLSKLKSSFGTREEEPMQASPAPTRTAPAVPVQAPMPRPVAEERPQQVSQQADPFAPKRAPLDGNGRIMRPEATQSEDDQLEIPAFLRRQAN